MVFKEHELTPVEPESVERKEPSFEMFFTRHGVALYREHERTLRSEEPEAPMDPNQALKPDLDPEHIESARIAAESFLSSFDPEADELFIVSSNLPRAIETADIYRQVAHEHGLAVTPHGKRARNEYANSLGGDEIRILDNLKVDVENLVTLSVFHPDVEDQGINWERVSDDTKEKWKKARAIIEADDKGGWGENFVAYADKISELYPDIGRAKAAYEKQFANLLKLGKFAASRSHDIGTGKNIKVLAFGHENYIRPFLQEYFGDPGLSNVETIKLEIGDDIVAERRGEKKVIE